MKFDESSWRKKEIMTEILTRVVKAGMPRWEFTVEMAIVCVCVEREKKFGFFSDFRWENQPVSHIPHPIPHIPHPHDLWNVLFPTRFCPRYGNLSRCTAVLIKRCLHIKTRTLRSTEKKSKTLTEPADWRTNYPVSFLARPVTIVSDMSTDNVCQ